MGDEPSAFASEGSTLLPERSGRCITVVTVKASVGSPPSGAGLAFSGLKGVCWFGLLEEAGAAVALEHGRGVFRACYDICYCMIRVLRQCARQILRWQRALPRDDCCEIATAPSMSGLEDKLAGERR